MAGRLIAAVALAWAALGVAPAARAQEEPPPPPPAPRPQEEPPPPPPMPREELPGQAGARPPAEAPGFRLGDLTEQTVVGDERVVAAVGGTGQDVEVVLPDFRLRCRNVVLWGDRDRLVDAVTKKSESLSAQRPEAILGPVLHAFYAEGDVVMRRANHEIRAERLFVDFAQNRAYVVHATIASAMEGRRGRTIPLSVRADVVRGTARDRYRAEGARFTTCTYAVPHYEFTSDEIDVDFSGRYASFDTAWWPVLRAQTIVGDEVPLALLPKLGGTTWFRTVPVQGASFGTSDRYGTEWKLTWGGDIEREDGTRWGDWRLRTDVLSARGPGLGIGLDHEGLPGRRAGARDEFELEGYWQRDDQETDSFSDRNFDGHKDADASDPDRGFARLWYRHFFDGGQDAGLFGGDARLDAAASWWSDRGYFAEYDRDRVETEDPQETYVQLRRTWGNEGVSVLGSWLLTDQTAYLSRRPEDLFVTNFANQTAYAPSATYHMIEEPILAQDVTGLVPVNLSVQGSAANVRRQYDEQIRNKLADGLDWRAEWVRRADLETRVTLPFALGDLNVNPAFGGSAYGVDEANGFTAEDHGAEGRWSAFWSLRAGTQAWRLFPDVRSDLLGVEALRHVVSLDASYLDRFKVSDEPGDFQANDMVEQLVGGRMGSVRMRNRLQTRRDGELVDWLDYETRFLYFFEPTEWTGYQPFGVREDLPMPLQRLDFPGEDKYLVYARDGSAYWQHRTRLAVAPRLWLVGEADYDMQLNGMETSAVGVRWFAQDRLSMYLGRRTIHADSVVVAVRADYRLSDKWGFGVEHQQETKEGDRLDTTLSLFRRAHDYTIAVEFESDGLLEETSFSLAVYPNDWLGGNDDPFARRKPLDYEALRWYR